MSQLPFEHQRKKVAANCRGVRETILWTEDDFGAQPKNLAVYRGADYGRNVLVISDKGSGYHHIKAGFPSSFRQPFACAVNLAALHDRVCSEMSARAWRARCLRCLRKTSLSFASSAWRLSRSANWRKAVRTSAEGLRRRDEFWVNSSRSLEVAASMAMVFMCRIIAAVLRCAQELALAHGARPT